MVISQNKLNCFLSSFGVPHYELWGRGETKTILDLFREIQQEECYLRCDENGLWRVTEIVKMLITDALFHGCRYLLEWAQYLPDGRYRERKQNPSGKMRRGESAQEAVLREAYEELGIKSHDCHKLSALPVKWENRLSKSY